MYNVYIDSLHAYTCKLAYQYITCILIPAFLAICNLMRLSRYYPVSISQGCTLLMVTGKRRICRDGNDFSVSGVIPENSCNLHGNRKTVSEIALSASAESHQVFSVKGRAAGKWLVIDVSM